MAMTLGRIRREGTHYRMAGVTQSSGKPSPCGGVSAVEVALSAEWSKGQTEGQITRLKCVQRQMYGRASFGRVKQRVLRAA